MIESLAAHYKFDAEAAWESLPEAVQQVLLYGSGEEEIKFSYALESGEKAGKKISKKHPFEGIIRNFERRYRETDSAHVREELARYRATQPCPDCGGTRLRKEARHVFVGEGEQKQPIYKISHITLGESLAYFSTLHAARRQGRHRRARDQRDPPAPEVFERRGPELPEPGPQRRHALRRRSAAHPPGEPDRQRPDRRDVRARRTQHRPAPARQRPPHHHPAAPARPWQHGAGGGARRRHDPLRRPRDRHGPGRGRARRPRDGARHLRRGDGHARLIDRPVPEPARARSPCPRGARPGCR